MFFLFIRSRTDWSFFVVVASGGSAATKRYLFRTINAKENSIIQRRKGLFTVSKLTDTSFQRLNLAINLCQWRSVENRGNRYREDHAMYTYERKTYVYAMSDMLNIIIC